jgi:hypothetical protein
MERDLGARVAQPQSPAAGELAQHVDGMLVTQTLSTGWCMVDETDSLPLAEEE